MVLGHALTNPRHDKLKYFKIEFFPRSPLVTLVMILDCTDFSFICWQHKVSFLIMIFINRELYKTDFVS